MIPDKNEGSNNNNYLEKNFKEFKEKFLIKEYEIAHERDGRFTNFRMILKGWCLSIIVGILFLSDIILTSRILNCSFYFILLLITVSFYLLECHLAALQRFPLDRIKRIEKFMQENLDFKTFKENIIKEKIPNMLNIDQRTNEDKDLKDFNKKLINEYRKNLQTCLVSWEILLFYVFILLVIIAAYLFYCIKIDTIIAFITNPCFCVISLIISFIAILILAWKIVYSMRKIDD